MKAVRDKADEALEEREPKEEVLGFREIEAIEVMVGVPDEVNVPTLNVEVREREESELPLRVEEAVGVKVPEGEWEMVPPPVIVDMAVKEVHEVAVREGVVVELAVLPPTSREGEGEYVEIPLGVVLEEKEARGRGVMAAGERVGVEECEGERVMEGEWERVPPSVDESVTVEVTVEDAEVVPSCRVGVGGTEEDMERVGEMVMVEDDCGVTSPLKVMEREGSGVGEELPHTVGLRDSEALNAEEKEGRDAKPLRVEEIEWDIVEVAEAHTEYDTRGETERLNEAEVVSLGVGETLGEG